MTAQELSKYFEAFPEIEEIQKTTDIAIGGMVALALHGLAVRRTGDVDIIVYQPAPNVINSILELSGDQEGSRGEIDGDLKRSFKVTRLDLTIDFLIEDEKEILPSLLSFHGIPVQSIEVVLDAKRQYGRPKDKKDLEILIEKNFLWN